MKKFISAVALSALMAGSAMAQGVVRQVEVDGATGNPEYPVYVLGSNGVNYMCKADTFVDDGVVKRLCIRDDDDGAVLSAGDLGPVAAGAGALVLIALAAGGGNDSTTTSTSASD
ncbi:hypothetical protein [Pseudosulfitobacter sp. DSM 107133]|uniref:hypothetical protein n=1 Tax=Pseudosulfitobacter sp. DSM 107133 TaxID=2883100 RepID=UPI000DF2A281|nr:hypothetical protein [Pseudosulfitobacter sp. DSM 107133]UOA27384.1 hypothetical protein DSM107133_02110 [Pseudosulfitobacter sp. DSM 107133]